MARRYALVPPSWLETVTKVQKVEPMVVDTIVEAGHEEDLSALFPKRLQSKAKLRLSYLKNVRQGSNNRVLYDGSGSAGSTLYDIVRYLVTDSGQFSAPRPIDIDQFRSTYCGGVPTAAYGKGKEYNKGKLEWKSLY